MDANKVETAEQEKSQNGFAGSQLRELNQSQLAFVGGGIGDTYF